MLPQTLIPRLGHKLIARIVAVLVALMAYGISHGALIVTLTPNPSPAPGLVSANLNAVGTAGEIIAGVAGVNIIGVHQVWPPFNSLGSPSVGFWNPSNLGPGDPAWRAFDSHFLLDPMDGAKVTGFIGQFVETNDGSDPAGLDLDFMGFDAREGVGRLSFANATDQIGLGAGAGGSFVPLIRLVVPREQALTMTWSLALIDSRGRSASVVGAVLLTGFPEIPEPSSAALAALALAGLEQLRRRQK